MDMPTFRKKTVITFFAVVMIGCEYPGTTFGDVVRDEWQSSTVAKNSAVEKIFVNQASENAKDWISLEVEPPSPIAEKNTLEPNRMLLEVLTLSDETQNAQLLSKVAVQLVKYGNRDQGLVLFEKALASIPEKDSSTINSIAIDLAHAGEVDKALAIGRDFINQGWGTDSVEIFLAVAIQLSEQGNSALANSVMAEALEAADDNPDYVLGHSISSDDLNETLANIAERYAQIENLDAALEVTHQLRDGRDIYGYLNSDIRGRAYTQIIPRIDDIQRVYAVYEMEKPNLDVNKGGGFSVMAEIAIRLFQLGDEELPFQILDLVDLGRIDDLTVLYQSSKAKNRILSGISLYLTRSGRYEEAINIAEQISSEPDGIINSFTASDFYHYKALSLIELGNAFNKLGNRSDAQAYFDEAFNLMQQPRTLKLQKEIAMAFAESGQIKTALRYVAAVEHRTSLQEKHLIYQSLLPVLSSLDQFDEMNNVLDRVNDLNVTQDKSMQAEFLLETVASLPQTLKTDLDISAWLNK